MSAERRNSLWQFTLLSKAVSTWIMPSLPYEMRSSSEKRLANQSGSQYPVVLVPFVESTFMWLTAVRRIMWVKS